MAETPESTSSSGRTMCCPIWSRRSRAARSIPKTSAPTGMLFAKLLLSPLPHARIRRIDASAALAMPGVVAVITGEDIPEAAAADAAWRSRRAAREHASRSRAGDRAALSGRADCGGRGDRRSHGGRRDREDQGRLRAAAVRRRSDRDAAAGRAESARRRQRLASAASRRR